MIVVPRVAFALVAVWAPDPLLAASGQPSTADVSKVATAEGYRAFFEEYDFQTYFFNEAVWEFNPDTDLRSPDVNITVVKGIDATTGKQVGDAREVRVIDNSTGVKTLSYRRYDAQGACERDHIAVLDEGALFEFESGNRTVVQEQLHGSEFVTYDLKYNAFNGQGDKDKLDWQRREEFGK